MLRRLICSSVGVLALLCVTGIPGQLYARGTMRSGMTTPSVRFSSRFSSRFRTFPRFNGGFTSPRFGTFTPSFGLRFTSPRFGTFSPAFEREFMTPGMTGFSPMFDRQFMDPRMRGF